jgi:pSer/pThr/pTyr-binding forkhead associated (FHA) protein
MQGIPVYRSVEEPRRAASPEVESDVLGALTILASDDSSLVGHRFEITTTLVTLGRSADNDLNFPGDKPVSRHHAEIYQIKGKLYLREVEMADASGMAKPPKYGTFLNQSPMGPEPALLKTGDEIQLGKRVRLRFEAYGRAGDEDERTYDDMTASADDLDRTQEQ